MNLSSDHEKQVLASTKLLVSKDSSGESLCLLQGLRRQSNRLKEHSDVYLAFLVDIAGNPLSHGKLLVLLKLDTDLLEDVSELHLGHLVVGGGTKLSLEDLLVVLSFGPVGSDDVLTDVAQ